MGEDHSFAHHLYYLIISFEHLWTSLFVLPNIAIYFLLPLSQISKKQKSRATLLTLTIELMELFLHFLLFTLSFLWVLELLTLFLIVFLLIIVKKNEKNDKQYLYQLDSIVIESSLLQSIAIIATDASIKNNIATSILYIHTSNQLLIKILHHVAFVTSAEAELFAIRCGINQASTKENISKIIVVTNFIHMAKKIFDPLSHLLQIYAVAILKKLHHFLSRNPNNLIKFWESPSHLNWYPHKAVDHESKSFNLMPIFPCKTSWNFSRKSKCDNILCNWKMTFQASDGKRNHFLNLLDVNFNFIELFYTKGGPWL